MLHEDLSDRTAVQVELVDDHPSARACAAGFLAASEGPAVVIAGGGGGTLRAVIEGICDGDASAPVPGPERVCVGALRLGSGNLLAKQLGVPRDPIAGMDGLLKNLKAGRTVPCCVMRCEVWKTREHSEIHHAAGLAGLGQFGRIPSDIGRWRLSRLHRSAARLLGIESLNNLEYALALFLRSLRCVLFADSAEMVEVHFQNQKTSMRLLSGVVMNFPIKALPFKPRVRVEDEAISIYLIPLRGRLSPLLQTLAPQRLLRHALCITLQDDQCLEIRPTDRECIEFFFDEDPLTTCGRLSFGVAGSLAFVPGPNYQPPSARGPSS